MAHNQDWREWLESLNASGAEYVVVGAIAMAHHGIVRYTGDLDVLVAPSEQNADRVIAALRAFGFGSLDITRGDLCVRDRVIQLGFPPARIDLLTSIDGVTWDEAWSGSVAGTYASVPVRFLSRSDLVRNKRAAGRPQDIADAARLEGQ